MDRRTRLADFFQTPDSRRDKFLARLFGLFSEDLVRDWCSDERAPYVNEGRPTLWAPGEVRGATLDFTLKDRATHKMYVAEMKVELEFEGYKYMTLERFEQLAHHRLPAFQRFLEIARDPTAYEVRVNAVPTAVEGAILIWGAVSDAGRQAVRAKTGLHDVLRLERIIEDLREWRPESYVKRLAERRQAANDLFDWLA